MALTDSQPGDGGELPEVVRHVPAEVVAGGVAELLAHVLGANWTVSVLAPALTAVARTVWEADRRQWQQAADAVSVAADELGGANVVERQALADPARTELFRRVVQAAGRTPIEEKITALGRVLAAGLPDDAKVDEALLLAGALALVEAPHVVVLQFLVGQPTEGQPTRRRQNTGGADQGHISASLPGLREMLPALLQALRGQGLVEEVGTPKVATRLPQGGISTQPAKLRWRPTSLGVDCVRLLEAADQNG